MGGFRLVLRLGELNVDDIHVDYIDQPGGSFVRYGPKRIISALTGVNFSISKETWSRSSARMVLENPRY